MSEVIEVNFNTKARIQKYVVKEVFCVNCTKRIRYDSRLSENMPYIDFPKSKGFCLCKDCAVAVKDVVQEEKWDE